MVFPLADRRRDPNQLTVEVPLGAEAFLPAGEYTDQHGLARECGSRPVGKRENHLLYAYSNQDLLATRAPPQYLSWFVETNISSAR